MKKKWKRKQKYLSRVGERRFIFFQKPTEQWLCVRRSQGFSCFLSWDGGPIDTPHDGTEPSTEIPEWTIIILLWLSQHKDEEKFGENGNGTGRMFLTFHPSRLVVLSRKPVGKQCLFFSCRNCCLEKNTTDRQYMTTTDWTF